MEIRKITPKKAGKIIDTRIPLGLFYCMENGRYIGIDNSTGEAWTEDFKTQTDCKRWLIGGEQSDQPNA